MRYKPTKAINNKWIIVYCSVYIVWCKTLHKVAYTVSGCGK